MILVKIFALMRMQAFQMNINDNFLTVTRMALPERDVSSVPSF